MTTDSERTVRWYCVDRFDYWTLCHDEAHANGYAKRRDADRASRAPHRVVRMVDAAEVEALRFQLEEKESGWQRTYDHDVSKLKAEVEALRAEVAELDALRDTLSDLLKRTAIALRGPEPPLTSWSWHDLPERAAAAIAAIDVMQLAAIKAAALEPKP